MESIKKLAGMVWLILAAAAAYFCIFIFGVPKLFILLPDIDLETRFLIQDDFLSDQYSQAEFPLFHIP